MNSSSVLSFSQLIDAQPEDVSYAFFTAQGWRDWMCDSVRFQGRPGGSYQLAWDNGWYASGSIREADRPSHLKMTWQGKDDPGSTEVDVDLKEEGNQTRVAIQHRGFVEGKAWELAREESEKGWKTALENLVSIFSTGVDLRITRRPLLGIFLNDFDEKIAKDMGMPVSRGVRIDKPVEGLGAEAAGLQSNDVIVEMNGVTVNGFNDLGSALDGQHTGDIVSVVAYRGSERKTFEMKLSGRNVVLVPMNPAAFVEQIQAVDAAVLTDLRSMFESVREEDADFTPSPQEWSAKEILAHLIDSERYRQFNITELMYDGQRKFPDDAGNVRERLQALLTVTPTVPELLNRLERSMRETLALLSLAGKLKARKGVLWRLGQGMLQYPDQHARSHMEQIKLVIKAAREG